VTQKPLFSCLFLVFIEIASPVLGQESQRVGADQKYPQNVVSTLPSTGAGEVAKSAVGQVGQRRTREDLTTKPDVISMTRVDLRIQNRVQSRIRNRIDPLYDPQANAASPFTVASEQVRTPRRR